MIPGLDGCPSWRINVTTSAQQTFESQRQIDRGETPTRNITKESTRSGKRDDVLVNIYIHLFCLSELLKNYKLFLIHAFAYTFKQKGDSNNALVTFTNSIYVYAWYILREHIT